MKKISKTILAIIMIVSLVLVFAGCKNNTTTNNNSSANQDNGKSKTYNLLNKTFSGDKYTVSLEDEDGAVVKLVAKGENKYIEANEDGSRLSIIQMDGKTYIISHDEKMYMVAEGEDSEMFDEDEMEILSKDDLEKIEKSEYKTGKEEINGKTYEYEEYVNEENGTERYYFDGNELKYIKTIDSDGEETIMKIIELSSNVDDSVFEIPSDYEKVDI